MERYSSQHDTEASPEELRQPNIEKLTGWLMGLQPEERAAKAKSKQESIGDRPAEELKTERYFERRKEVRDDAQAIKQGGMVAVGEVLADKSSSALPHIIGAVGIQRVSKQKKMATEESRVSGIRSATKSGGLTLLQAIQVGVAVGISIGLLILLWLSVR